MEQIVIQPQAVGLCRFHKRVEDCTRLRTLGCIGKDPSLPANDKRADSVFNLVVADFNLTMFKEFALLPVLSCASLHSFSSLLDLLDSSFSSTMDKYRTISGSRQGGGLLSGYAASAYRTS